MIFHMDVLAAVINSIPTTQSALSKVVEAMSFVNKLWQLVTLEDFGAGFDILQALYNAVLSRKLQQWYNIVLYVQHLRDRLVFGRRQQQEQAQPQAQPQPQPQAQPQPQPQPQAQPQLQMLILMLVRS
jgi:hypothetical protein